MILETNKKHNVKPQLLHLCHNWFNSHWHEHVNSDGKNKHMFLVLDFKVNERGEGGSSGFVRANNSYDHTSTYISRMCTDHGTATWPSASCTYSALRIRRQDGRNPKTVTVRPCLKTDLAASLAWAAICPCLPGLACSLLTSVVGWLACLLTCMFSKGSWAELSRRSSSLLVSWRPQTEQRERERESINKIFSTATQEISSRFNQIFSPS